MFIAQPDQDPSKEDEITEILNYAVDNIPRSDELTCAGDDDVDLAEPLADDSPPDPGVDGDASVAGPNGDWNGRESAADPSGDGGVSSAGSSGAGGITTSSTPHPLGPVG